MMKKAVYKLELPKIKLILSGFCTNQLSKAIVEDLEPNQELDTVRVWQAETTEARDILRLYPLIPLGGIKDIRNILRRTALGATLEPTDLLAIKDTLFAGRRLRRFCLEIKGNFPLIQKIAAEIKVFPKLEDLIDSKIDDEANVRDSASPELQRIRRKTVTIHEKIKAKLDSILRSQVQQKYLQDNLITIRGDRYVVPVKQEYRSIFPGLVHDQSASGATLFIEPLAVVELNNELRSLLSAEKREIEQILNDLTKEVGQYVTELEISLARIAYLDFIFAKGKLSEKFDACEPILNGDGKVRIIQGRHPLIQGDVVPVSISLGYDFNALVITGPNTGGKTVTLKTVGLFTLMAMLGLHIPADPGSEVAVFTSIFADIGDEQSIEQSLSTFSSHLTNIIEIVNNAGPHSLVLLDELGAGTDPTEGSALAMSILEYLYNAGCKIIATTHYSELKAFAYSSAGFKNASVEFDIETLRPTYRLLIGVPGRSNALDIALRLGLPQTLVAKARSFISEEEAQVTDMLQDLEENRRRSIAGQEEIERLRIEINNLKATLEKEKQELKIREAKILEHAYLEAKEVISKAQVQAQEIIDKLRSDLTEEARRAQDRASQEAKQKLKNEAEKYAQRANELVIMPGKPPEHLKPGDQVFITNLQQKGVVLSPPNAQGEVMVQAGILKISVKLSNLRLSNEDKNRKERSVVTHLVQDKSTSISSELDLRGLLVDEALDKVDKYLDDAVLANLQKVYLIHGKGTGALRAAINNYLAVHPHTRSFRLGDHSEGGTGITVVELKQ